MSSSLAGGDEAFWLVEPVQDERQTGAARALAAEHHEALAVGEDVLLVESHCRTPRRVEGLDLSDGAPRTVAPPIVRQEPNDENDRDASRRAREVRGARSRLTYTDWRLWLTGSLDMYVRYYKLRTYDRRHRDYCFEIAGECLSNPR